jgi:cytochrome c553
VAGSSVATVSRKKRKGHPGKSSQAAEASQSPATVSTPRRPIGTAGVIAAGIAVVLALVWWWQREDSPQMLKEQANRTATAQHVAAAEYVDEQQCTACHGAQVDSWRGSHHDLAMQEANASTVLGNFNDAVFDKDKVRTRFFQRDGKFWINTDGPDGKPADYQVKYTFGVEPLQQYLLELDHGRLQAFTVAWDTQRRRWFHLYPQERIDHRDELHWTKLSQNWNFMCAECHSTEEELRRSDRRLPDHVEADRRRLPGVPRAGQ